MKKGTLNIGPLKGVKVRTRVRLATITELVKNGVVVGTGIAALHPGEEHTMNFKTGARLAGERAVEDFFEKAGVVAETLPSGFAKTLLLVGMDQDRRQAKRNLIHQLMD